MAWKGADRGTRLELDAEAPPTSAFPPAVVDALVAATDALAYSSGVAAAVGGGLTLAVGRALGSESAWLAATLVGSGVLFIYGVDRLRDVEGDRASSPMRTGFVLRHRRGLGVICGAAGLCVAGLLMAAPAPVAALCIALGSVGLLHRRLKQSVPWKVGYVALAWTAACVGIPWLWGAERATAHPAATLGWASILVGSTLVANLIASNLREGKLGERLSRWQPEVAMLVARCALLASVLAAVAAPDSMTPLAWIPACEAVALAFFRPTERYGHLAVDGALLVGAVVSIVRAGGAA